MYLGETVVGCLCKTDNCNSLLCGASKHLVHAKMQNVENGAARIIVRPGKLEHISPVLKELYWLPVELRIVYRIYVLTFKCVHGLGHKYLQELLDGLQV